MLGGVFTSFVAVKCIPLQNVLFSRFKVFNSSRSNEGISYFSSVRGSVMPDVEIKETKNTENNFSYEGSKSILALVAKPDFITATLNKSNHYSRIALGKWIFPFINSLFASNQETGC